MEGKKERRKEEKREKGWIELKVNVAKRMKEKDRRVCERQGY